MADKVTIVTGATSRYGYHFCQGLAAPGSVFGYNRELGDDESIE